MNLTLSEWIVLGDAMLGSLRSILESRRPSPPKYLRQHLLQGDPMSATHRISWDAPTDGVAPYHYGVLITSNGTPLVSTDVPSGTQQYDQTFPDGATVHVEVLTKDSAGAVSSSPAVLDFTAGTYVPPPPPSVSPPSNLRQELLSTQP